MKFVRLLYQIEQKYREEKSEENVDETSSESDSDDDGATTSDANKPSKSGSKNQLDYIQKFLANRLRFLHFDDGDESDGILKKVDFQGLIDHWQDAGFKKIITMVGAGISTCKIFLNIF